MNIEGVHLSLLQNEDNFKTNRNVRSNLIWGINDSENYKLSFFIPTFCRAKTITETIESIWSSTDTSGSAQVAIAEEQKARIAEDTRIANLLTTETSSRVDADSNLQNQINTLDTNIDRNVVTATGFTYNGDNVVSTHTKTNLKTGLETQESHTFNLANQTTAGLMSTEDVKTLSDLQARVGNLENKTTRL